jgi:hypothetical protein
LFSYNFYRLAEAMTAMKFAKIVFWIAGVWGVLMITPLYFMFDLIGRKTPADHASGILLWVCWRGIGLADRVLGDCHGPATVSSVYHSVDR